MARPITLPVARTKRLNPTYPGCSAVMQYEDIVVVGGFVVS